MTDHPITPPPELVQQWDSEAVAAKIPGQLYLATQAAQWAADQELLACGNYLKQCAQWEEEDVTEFYNYRRPKPPSLKEQALEVVTGLEKRWDLQCDLTLLRRALEALP
jgi:hypothetical protein